MEDHKIPPSKFKPVVKNYKHNKLESKVDLLLSKQFLMHYFNKPIKE